MWSGGIGEEEEKIYAERKKTKSYFITRLVKCHFLTQPDFEAENVYTKKCVILTTQHSRQCSLNDKI